MVNYLHRLIIKGLGPITHCDISINDFMVFTGPQASGKSTIAKSIFFFRTVKEDILNLFLKQFSFSIEQYNLKDSLIKSLRNKFLQIFGSSWAMNPNMQISYFYSDDTNIKISLKPSDYDEPNYVWIELSDSIKNWLMSEQIKISNSSSKEIKSILQKNLSKLFEDSYDTIFIPAGRSLITLLTNQLNYIYTSMDESQRRTIDYCTQTYIEQILKIKPSFEKGIIGMRNDKIQLTEDKFNRDIINAAIDLIDSVLKGRYVYANGEERLVLSDNNYVKINFTSSGQQESVWIFNLIYFYLLENRSIYLILEEPESHLYPDAQKSISELIGLVLNNHSNALITTHSPYILGSFNNMIYASQISSKYSNKVYQIINKNKIIDYKKANAYFVENGFITDCIDHDINLIKNEVIDGASDKINDENDALYSINMEDN